MTSLRALGAGGIARTIASTAIVGLVFVWTPALAAAPHAAPASLGRIDFPVTGSPSARQHFLRGMLALHSFWYEEAADEFRASTAASPDFAMGIWGEALTHYHPVWTEEDLAASRAVMARMPSAPRVTAQERSFIDAARVLFGAGDRATRWRGYAEAMAAIHGARPDDDEAATLYAVALLGAALGERQLDGQSVSFRPFAEAGALALDVMARNPAHPGAAHYVIHAFDDPEHAILALPAARRYAAIAPEAYHARHMPSHIFVQLGMWPEAVASNEAAWAASETWVKRRQLDSSYLDFHSLGWLLSVRLELGQRRLAAVALGRARDALTRSRNPGRLPLIYGTMAGEYLLQTGEWEHFDEWLAPLVALAEGPAARADDASPPAGALAAAPTCHSATERAARMNLEARALLTFLRGEASAARGDTAAVATQAATEEGLQPQFKGAMLDACKIRALELRALAAESARKPDEAATALREAIALDERTPAVGPAGDATPRERLGALLARQGKPVAALTEFVRDLEIHPGRTRALLGAARAATAAADPRAAGWWSRLAATWATADADTPGIEEARAARPLRR